jgi:hypothetical protein
MKNALLVIGVWSGAIAVFPLGAAAGSLSTDIRGNPPSGAVSSDTTPPAPARALANTWTPRIRDDVQPAVPGAVASDTLPPLPSQDNRYASPPRPNETPNPPAGALSSDTPPPTPSI